MVTKRNANICNNVAISSLQGVGGNKKGQAGVQHGLLFCLKRCNSNQRTSKSQGLMPVCFLKAVLKCEMEE